MGDGINDRPSRLQAALLLGLVVLVWAGTLIEVLNPTIYLSDWWLAFINIGVFWLALQRLPQAAGLRPMRWYESLIAAVMFFYLFLLLSALVLRIID